MEKQNKFTTLKIFQTTCANTSIIPDRPVNGTGWAWASVVQSRPENRTGLLGVAQSRP